MGRGGHYVYVINEDGTRSRGQWVSNKTHDKMMESASKQSDLMSQRRLNGQNNTTPNEEYKVIPSSQGFSLSDLEKQGVRVSNLGGANNVQEKAKKAKPEVQLDPDYKKAVNKLAAQIRALRARGASITDEKIISKLVDIAAYDDDGEDSLWESLNTSMYYKGRDGLSFHTRKEVQDLVDGIEKRLGISLSPSEADRNRARPKPKYSVRI